MRRERKAEVEAERHRGGERLMAKKKTERGRDGVGEHARATRLCLFAVYFFNRNLAGRGILASCPSRACNWSHDSDKTRLQVRSPRQPPR